MQTTRIFTYGLLIGGAIGSATALLLAPRSGRRTRQELQSGADELGEQVAELPARLRNGVRRLATQARHKVENSAERAGDAIDATENVLAEALACNVRASSAHSARP